MGNGQGTGLRLLYSRVLMPSPFRLSLTLKREPIQRSTRIATQEHAASPNSVMLDIDLFSSLCWPLSATNLRTS